MNTIKECTVCGRLFFASTKKSRYCPECKLIAHQKGKVWDKQDKLIQKRIKEEIFERTCFRAKCCNLSYGKYKMCIDYLGYSFENLLLRTGELKMRKKFGVKEFEDLKKELAPVYLDNEDNIITVIELDDIDLPTPQKAFDGVCLLVKISKDFEIDYIKSFKSWKKAEEEMNNYCQQNGFKIFNPKG